MLINIEIFFNPRLQSYLGILSHANQYELGTALKMLIWLEAIKKCLDP